MSGVWVWIEQVGGKAINVSWEAVGLARSLADDLGQTVIALVFGANASELAHEAFQYGADRAIVCEDATLAEFRLEPYATLVSRLAQERRPAVILAGASSCGRDLTGAVAVDLETGLISDVIGIGWEDGMLKLVRPVYTGKLLAKEICGSSPQIITIRKRAFQAPVVDEKRTGKIETVAAALAEDDIVTKIVSMEASTGQIGLADASIIVSGGRGVGGPNGFDLLWQFSNAIGAALGASRAAVDVGWIDYEYQVGQTGKTVSPDLYIACGISGAIQHQAGIRTAKVIVSINTDPEAPILKTARYAIVGDVVDVVPSLMEAFEKRLG
ncbi:MAG: electron transfer flavoprotein subunit alpha/FixB family protein [Anaerolineae bacterium]|nr:electron transfer flavoprotein subunit alpha/FixB family protein [Anaerolineae bacterium]